MIKAAVEGKSKHPCPSIASAMAMIPAVCVQALKSGMRLQIIIRHTRTDRAALVVVL